MIWRLLLVLLLMVSSVSSALAGPGDAVTIGRSQSLHSAVLSEDREIQVSLPASYAWSPEQRYPVLVVLDGETQFRHTAASTDFLAAQGEIPEMIVVAVTSTVRVRDFTQTDWPKAWIGGGGADNFKRFLATELIPFVDKTYRTDGFRVLVGHSAGGQFALHVLGTQPSLFKAYFVLSPSLDWDDRLPQRELQRAFATHKPVPAFVYVATSDDAGQALADDLALVDTLKTAPPPEFRWFYRPFPNESHGGVALLAQIDALRQLYWGYRFSDDMAAQGLPAAEKHFSELSKRLGWTVPVPESVINTLGYDALSKGKVPEAIALFERNVATFPGSANAHDSIADAYEKAGRLTEAAASAARGAALAVKVGLPNRGDFERHADKLNRKITPRR
jgi:uncharacterized protein